MTVGIDNAKQQINTLVDKYNKVAEEKRINKYNEEMTKAEFIEPLFEALGWDLRNKSHQDEVTREEKISKDRVDYGFRINGIPKFFLEAKSLKSNLDNPKFVEQAINYAWNKGCTWAVLTDFESVKIFNAEVRTTDYSQSHLKTIACYEFLDRFNELWLLSKESFEQGLLDKEAEKWGKKIKKSHVGKQLLADFTLFRELLSKNIAKLNQTRDLTQDELDESVQRILDRLIFIRNCEDRELEEKQLISNLREWESRGKGQLVKNLREVFSYFDRHYNSKIFAKHLCDQLDIDNEVLHEIVEGLHYTKDRSISYDFSAIEADVLGNIYEQYLGHILKKTEKRASLKENQTHRKEQGVYYTPTYIVDYIVRNTLGRLLKAKNAKPDKIRVLDPACGSGSFLIKSFDILREYYLEHDESFSQSRLDTTVDSGTYTKTLDILHNNIFGIDLDKQAVEVAQLNLLLKVAEKGQRLPLLQENIQQGNSLTDDSNVAGKDAFNWEQKFPHIMKEQGGFDIVIGNPPYIDSEEMVRSQPELREAYSRSYSTAKGNWDIFCIFIEKGLKLLRNGGYLGMIVPNKLLAADYALEIRNFVQRHEIVAIRDYSRIPVFQASVYPIVIIIKKESPNKNKFTAELMEPYGDSAVLSLSKEIKQEDLKKTPRNTWAHIFGGNIGEIVTRIVSKSWALGDLAEVSGAATVSEAYELKRLIKELSTQKDYFKFINTGTIDRYSSLWKCFRTRYIGVSYEAPVISKDDLKKYSHKRYEQSLKSKIIVAGMVKRLECCLDDGHYLAGKSTTIITQKPTLVKSEEVDLKLILALLNSKLMAFVYKNLFKSLSLQAGYMRVGSPQIKSLPIKDVSEPDKSRILPLVNEMISLNEKLNKIGDKMTDERAKIEEQINQLDKEIDQIVYKLYGLSENEVKLVEDSF